MAVETSTWGEERIADEPSLKLQIQLSPRNLDKYVRRLPHPRGIKRPALVNVSPQSCA
jgi:hypothetical protein